MNNKNTKNKIAVLTGMLVMTAFLLCGCGKKNDNLPQYFGPEVYNASYICISDQEVIHIVPVLSKRNLKEADSLEVTGEGARYNFEYVIEKTDYNYKGYTLYNILLSFSDMKFDNNIFEVKDINLYFGDDVITFNPDKCEIKKIEGIIEPEYININSTPLKMPEEMMYIPVEVSSDYPVKVKDIFITNDDMKILQYVNPDETETEEFCEFEILPGAENIKWRGRFEIEKNSLSMYKVYGTSVVIVYEYKGSTYYTVPAVARTVYNPFEAGYNGIEKYYEYLKG